MLEIVLFDQPHLVITPSTALCIHTGSIAHARAKYIGKGRHITSCILLCMAMAHWKYHEVHTGYVFERALVLYYDDLNLIVKQALGSNTVIMHEVVLLVTGQYEFCNGEKFMVNKLMDCCHI